MNLTCDELDALLAPSRICEPSDNGLRVLTHCLYPSADPVYVHIAAWGDGYRVSDGGGVSRSILVHGRDEHAMQAGFSEACNRHSLKLEGGTLVALAPTREWLPAAIAAVANGASMAAAIAVEHVTQRIEKGLVAKIYETISNLVPAHQIAKDYEFRGKSGKAWRIDYAVVRPSDGPLLIKAVTPHHTSISTNYTAFGDIGPEGTERFCVFSRSLQRDDASLLRQVALLVPLSSLDVGARNALRQVN